MSEDIENKKKELARLKRIATDLASRVHDIVEESLLQDYKELLTLSQQINDACESYHKFKKENGL